MKAVEHHIQDACELYAVAVLQRLSEEGGRAATESAERKMRDFVGYFEARGLTERDLRRGPYRQYVDNVELHLPDFYTRLTEAFPGETLDFEDVEAEYRNLGKKGDFLIKSSAGEISVSLKNYRADIRRPQVCSGTFNSFIVNFLFESRGVGSFWDPATDIVFRSSSFDERDAAFEAAGLGAAVPLLHELDELNRGIKARFVYSDEWEFVDEQRFDAARKECGHAGAAIAARILDVVGSERVRDRLLRMTGLDGVEHHLFMDGERCSDSITNPYFRRLHDAVQEPSSTVTHSVLGQGIRFVFMEDPEALLTADVPFTINKNGAWISDKSYRGGKLHKKEGVVLEYGQRRPKKSKELATSVNTWVNFEAAGIFSE